MKKHITAFYVETLLLIVVFLAIILVLTQVFAAARLQSRGARLLTHSVVLAEKAAEAVSASDSEDELLSLLDEGGNARRMPDASGVTARYSTDMRPDPEGELFLDVTWLPEEQAAGTMVHSAIQVWYDGETEPLYQLDTAVFLREAAG